MDVSYGSINYWFDGKDDIYISVVKYGTEKVVNELFEMASKTITNPKDFFDSYLDELDKYILEFRLIFQVTASPIYGDRMREKAKDFLPLYEKCIGDLSEILGCESEKLTPIIYMLLAVTSDYIVWEDRPTAEFQMNYLYSMLMDTLNPKQQN